MTALLVVFVLVSLVALHQFGTLQARCLRCGGRGAHRYDCPLRKHEP